MRPTVDGTPGPIAIGRQLYSRSVSTEVLMAPVVMDASEGAERLNAPCEMEVPFSPATRPYRQTCWLKCQQLVSLLTWFVAGRALPSKEDCWPEEWVSALRQIARLRSHGDFITGHSLPCSSRGKLFTPSASGSYPCEWR